LHHGYIISKRHLTFTLITSFFFNHPSPTDIYTLSLHDALPIFPKPFPAGRVRRGENFHWKPRRQSPVRQFSPCSLLKGARRKLRSEEHTSELQSRENLVCRLLLEKKKKKKKIETIIITNQKKQN